MKLVVVKVELVLVMNETAVMDPVVTIYISV